MPTSYGKKPAQTRAEQLMQQREQILRDIDEQESILKMNNVGMKDPLVDAEGFPRGDIDVFAVRQARARLIELANDHKGVMNDIHEALIAMHQEAGVVAGSEAPVTPDELPAPSAKITFFAKVDAVAPDSPADHCGLKRGDLLFKFGSVSSMGDIASFVATHENVEVEVRAFRPTEAAEEPQQVQEADLVTLKLIPSKWNGRGLLGCHVSPL